MVQGRLGSDQVCFNDDSDSTACYKNKLTFLLVNKAIGQDTASGVLGLGPKSELSYFKGFVQQMKDASDVGKSDISPIFSLYYTDRSLRRSALTFGQPDIKKYAKSGLTESDVFYANLVTKKEQNWAVSIGKVRFSDDGFDELKFTVSELAFSTQVKYAILPYQHL